MSLFKFENTECQYAQSKTLDNISQLPEIFYRQFGVNNRRKCDF